MAQKENIAEIGKNVGKLAAAGAVLYGGIYFMENRSYPKEPTKPETATAQVLTEAEVAELRNYEKLMAESSIALPTQTPTAASAIFKIQSQELATSARSAPEMTAAQKAQIGKYMAELPTVIEKIRPTPAEIEDLEIYYPIYRAGQDRFGTPWYLTWIVHEAESTASRNPNAFDENCIQCGAMQIDSRYHPKEDIDRANVGLEYLMAIPTRYAKWDTTDIIWGASALKEYVDQTGSVLGGLKRYSAAGPAQNRYQKYLLLQSELGN